MAIINKYCSTCKVEKPSDEFHKRSSNKDGLQSVCKKCAKIYSQINKEKLSTYSKNYRSKNKEKSANYNLLYRAENKLQISKQRKIYRENNTINIAEKKRAYENNKTHNDPLFKLRKKVSLFVRLALSGGKRDLSVLDYLPYTINELKVHLEKQFEPWMNWQNWGSYSPKTWNDNDQATWTWQLDHIIPQAHLPYISMEDENFKKCWSLNNLRPLSAKENIILGSKVRSL